MGRTSLFRKGTFRNVSIRSNSKASYSPEDAENANNEGNKLWIRLINKQNGKGGGDADITPEEVEKKKREAEIVEETPRAYVPPFTYNADPVNFFLLLGLVGEFSLINLYATFFLCHFLRSMHIHVVQQK